eukprot:7217540-Alexandrium_andersonii.AAC.1
MGSVQHRRDAWDALLGPLSPVGQLGLSLDSSNLGATDPQVVLEELPSIHDGPGPKGTPQEVVSSVPARCSPLAPLNEPMDLMLPASLCPRERYHPAVRPTLSDPHEEALEQSHALARRQGWSPARSTKDQSHPDRGSTLLLILHEEEFLRGAW